MASLVSEDLLGAAELMRGLSVSDSSPRVIHAFTEEIEKELAAVFTDVATLALDAEGVDLSRDGRISVVQLATPQVCFLFDVLDKAPEDPLVAWLRGPLEDSNVLKIIHDCRMDSDALHHKLHITLTNVHDTSCWMNATSMTGRQYNLNNTLKYFGLAVNGARDGNVYKDNHAFWAARPLTEQMIKWASGDVLVMFELHRCQLERTNSVIKARAETMTEHHLTDARSANIATIQVQGRYVGRFIGKGGANLRGLESRTKTKIYNRGPRSGPVASFIVFYHNDGSLREVQRAASAMGV